MAEQPVVENYFYDLDGLTDSKYPYAKLFKTTTKAKDGDRETFRYKVATYCGNLYDPLGAYSKRESTFKQDFRYLDVSKETFINYAKYLETKDNNYFTAACRGFIND